MDQQWKENVLIFFVYYFSLSLLLVCFLSVDMPLKMGIPIAQPYDPDHRACGVDDDVYQNKSKQFIVDYPYIYFANPTNPNYLYVTTCVAECPQEESDTPPSTRHTKISHLEETKKNSKLSSELKCQPNSIVKNCKQNLLSSNPEEVVIIYNTELFMKTV